jgi:hypothetical protein
MLTENSDNVKNFSDEELPIEDLVYEKTDSTLDIFFTQIIIPYVLENRDDSISKQFLDLKKKEYVKGYNLKEYLIRISDEISYNLLMNEEIKNDYEKIIYEFINKKWNF